MDRRIIEAYVWGHFNRYFEIEESELATKNIHFPDNGRSFWLLKHAHPEYLSTKPFNDTTLPILFEGDNQTEWYSIKGNSLEFNYDLISTIFYYMSGWQEEHCTDFDQYNRFPYSKSIQKKFNNTTIPVVNHYFFIIRQGIETLLGVTIPLKEQFSINITHDIDIIFSGWRAPIKEALLRGNIFKVMKYATQKFFLGKSPNQNLEKILATEKKAGLNSTFYFLPNHDKQKGIKNADYPINHPYVRRCIARINQEPGFKLGLHTPSFEELSEREIDIAKAKIHANISDNRFHYLACQQQDFEHFENTKITKDSSLGFAEHIGFRHGIAWPFHPFNFKTNEAFRIIELPLAAMDVTMINEGYMGLSKAEAYSELEKLINNTIRVEGTFTLLWHNNTFFGGPIPFPLTLLKKYAANA